MFYVLQCLMKYANSLLFKTYDINIQFNTISSFPSANIFKSNVGNMNKTEHKSSILYISNFTLNTL